ncbi:cilia- and flagella-associated protein 52-like isoform X1 [Conger conger]|uniref:cilia- and flagella-associated protein 52-like isoform X1 n=1 Tax=Conger conger TaxID=82655 RepID=UPI002A598B28|nr:cilia- and flagella-associated protein 52-like isoform X1 [Conger conger]
MSEEMDDITLLELDAVIGFNGHVVSGLILHPDEAHLIYPLGCTVIQRNIQRNTQEFLSEHTNNVSCVAVSKSGRYVASGQATLIGFKADVIIWDNSKKEIHAKLILHKAKVEDMDFSPNEKFLATLGGQDDGSIVVWNIERGDALCGSPAAVHSGILCLRLRFSNLSDNIFISAGNGTIRVWEIDLARRKVQATECQIGQLRRVVKCIEVSPDDNFFYCGTSSGDILKMNLRTKLLNVYGPLKDKFTQGVSALKLLKSGDILVGSGDGLVSVCKEVNFSAFLTVQLEGGVTSFALPRKGHQLYVGTNACNIYSVRDDDFSKELFCSSHSYPVSAVAFPYGTSELFATCSRNDIRVWHTDTSRELLRIVVPNVTCNALDFTMDGRCIVSAWSDGQIRGFTPETGKLMFIIDNAHCQGATAMACCKDCRTVVSGGGEGQLRVWDVQPGSYRLIESMKEHKSAITCIALKSDDTECVSASADGACIVWDLLGYVRKQMVLANSMFKCVCYHPDGHQIITSGTDRKIAYWEVSDGVIVRDLEGSLTGSINAMDISQDGRYFVTGGDDRLLKVWTYTRGEVTHVGLGHSGSISTARICSTGRCVISTSQDGAVLRWRFPHPPRPGTA